MAAEEESKWWRNPQGIVAACTIVAMILTFFYIRERQMWENSNRIAAVELRGDKAIISVNTRFERIESDLKEQRDRINFLERKIDRLEIKDDEQEEKIKGLSTSHQ